MIVLYKEKSTENLTRNWKVSHLYFLRKFVKQKWWPLWKLIFSTSNESKWNIHFIFEKIFIFHLIIFSVSKLFSFWFPILRSQLPCTHLLLSKCVNNWCLYFQRKCRYEWNSFNFDSINDTKLITMYNPFEIIDAHNQFLCNVQHFFQCGDSPCDQTEVPKDKVTRVSDIFVYHQRRDNNHIFCFFLFHIVYLSEFLSIRQYLIVCAYAWFRSILVWFVRLFVLDNILLIVFRYTFSFAIVLWHVCWFVFS